LGKSLVDKYALLPDEIDRESLKMVQASLPNDIELGPDEHYVLCRIVRAEGDPAISRDVKFSPEAITAGLKALQSGNDIITDVRMVEMGISKLSLNKSGLQTRCVIDTEQVAKRALKEQTTRSVASLRELAPYLGDAIVAIGNAPTALLALLDMIDNEEISEPALIIGMPVGFVACPESKEELTKRSTPYISILGRRGGSSAAAATVNALLDLMGTHQEAM